MAPSRLSPPPTPELSKGLTPAQVADWHANGYLIIPDALSPEQVQNLRATSDQMLQDFTLDDHPMTKFSTGENEAHVGDDYFLTSGDKVRFFFEEDAFDRASGALSKPKHLAINKVGHALHMHSPPFAAASLSSSNARIARALGFTDPRILQSMLICKQPEIGGRVPPHQDSVFLYTDPPSAVGFWYALEDCTRLNGCLAFAPGSHRKAAVRKRFVRTAAPAEGGAAAGGEGTDFAENLGARWPEGLEGSEEQEVADEEYVMGEVKAGTLVLIHGNVLHKSERNTSDKGRLIYTFHCIEGGHEYDARNWLQPPEGGFTRLNDAL